MSLKFRLLVVAFALFLSLVSSVWGQKASSAVQAGAGEIRMQVRDPNGRPIVADGTLAGPAQDQERDVHTDAGGLLTISGLTYGRYRLKLSHPGFSTQIIDFQVQSATPIRHDVRLRIGNVSTTINVVGSAPFGAPDVPLSDVPVPVQTLTARTIEDTNAIDLTNAMNRRLNGVYVNENQNNPFQPDVNYRGYTASPLVGSPAGLSVYLDGVRQNQPFGDVVSWDLIPKLAINSMELIPGSNPVYGLNTLGGAIAVQTKDGNSAPGFAISGYGGNFGRRGLDAEYGGNNNAGLNWYAATTIFNEDGWRVASPSSVRQFFTKLGYTRGRTSILLSGGYAINDLTGNGTQDFRAINRTVGLNHGYESVYSIPDQTKQHSPFLTLNVTQSLTNSVSITGNAYFRYVRTNTTNGDINDDSFDQSLYELSPEDQEALTDAGIPFPPVITPENTPFPFLLCIAQGLEKDEPGSACTGVDTDTVDKQHAYGVSGMISWNTAHNRLAVGAGWDHGTLTFVQTGQYGYLNPDGITVTRIPTFLDGSTEVDGEPQDNRVNLHGTTNTPSVFVTDTVSLGKWVFTASGRYNHTNINNIDRLPPVDYRGSLTAVNVYERFNPSAGVVYKASDLLNAYFDYGEASRAPTSTELGCADANFPCSLPNALVSDPPLKQVVSRTVDVGVRGGARAFHWNADYFHGDNYNDLLFVASQQTGFGFFQNFGKTRRQGVEGSLSYSGQKLNAGAEYTFLSATYQSSQVIGSGSNSTNSNALDGGVGVPDGGNITVEPGDQIPQVPQHMLKLFAGYQLFRKLSIDADFNLISASYVRGNENNLHQPDGVFFLGPGKSPGYGVVNLGARYKINSYFELFGRVDNLLNRHYYTAGQLATTPYDSSGKFTAQPFGPITFDGDTEFPVRSSTFLAPGAPITVFGGVRVIFGRK